MKRPIILLTLLAFCFCATATELPKFLSDLQETETDRLEELQDKYEKRMKVGSVTDDSIRNDDDEKIASLKFSTTQYTDDHDLHYQMRVTIELTNKKIGECGFAQLSKRQNGFSDKITGAIDWEFQIPHGVLGKKAKISAYAVEYGIFEDGVFFPMSGRYDDVDSADEIKERTTERLDGLKCTQRFVWVY